MPSQHTVRECLDVISSEISGAAERPRREAELMIMERSQCDALWLMTNQDAQMQFDSVLQEWTQRRKAHEPLEYIFNRVSFYSREFYIAPGALIPRPETELLIDAVLGEVDPKHSLTLCEVGVGSGAVSIVLAEQLPKAKLIGVDISETALGVSAKNIEAFGLEQRIALRKSDLLEQVGESLDVLVSNPPYIAAGVALEPNLGYEPGLALFAGERGMDVIEKLMALTSGHAIPLFCCEMGYDQRDMVTELLPDGYSVSFYKDLAGLDRGFIMKRIAP